MAKSKYGKIWQISDFSFAWQIPDFINSTKNYKFRESPDLQFKGKFWKLCFYAYRNKFGDLLSCFQLMRVIADDPNPCTETYRLCIYDIEGEPYWKSTVLNDDFCFGNQSGIPQELLESGLKKDRNRIATGGVLTLHLAFNPPIGWLPTVREGLNELSNTFKDMLLKGHNADVTLNVNGREFKAHKLILINRSPVFEKMFKYDMVELNSGSVKITDCDPDVFSVFLLFLYSGKVEDLTSSNVVELYNIGDKYAVKGLTEYCVKYMLNNMTVDSFCDIISLALRHSELELLESANMFLAENVEQIICTEKWKVFSNVNEAEDDELSSEV